MASYKPSFASHTTDQNEAGYSLIEILFALAIFALIVSISGGIGIRALTAQSERTERRQIVQSIGMLRYSALIEERNIQISSFTDWPNTTERPDTNWQFQANPPLVINRAGQCSASDIQLISPRDRTYRYRVDPERCALIPV